MTIKNKRMKMSPGGIITLTVAARKALGMKVNQPDKMAVTTEGNCIVISSKAEPAKKTCRISKSGQMELSGDAKALLLKSKNRHYWLKLSDKDQEARLMPF